LVYQGLRNHFSVPIFLQIVLIAKHFYVDTKIQVYVSAQMGFNPSLGYIFFHVVNINGLNWC